MVRSSNQEQLQLLLKFICESVNTGVEFNSKLMRDILDVVEGLMRGALNSKGNYDHSSLKLKSSYISETALSLSESLSSVDLLKVTHREHAIPLKIVLRELYRLKNLNPESLRCFLETRLISVLITKEEQLLLDGSPYKIKDVMPVGWNGINPFARFEIVGIQIRSRNSIQHAA